MKPPKLCRHKRTGQGYATYKGRKYWLGKYGTDECARRYRELLAELAKQHLHETGVVPRADLSTVTQAIVAWGLYAEERYATEDGGITRDAETVKAVLKEIGVQFGSVRAYEFGTQHVKWLRDRMAERGCARTYINQSVAKIRRWVKWCVSEDWMTPDQLIRVQSLAALRKGQPGTRETKAKRSVPWEELQLLLPYCHDTFRDLLTFIFWSGSRPGEASSANSSEIDTTSEPWLWYPERHKNEHRGQPLVKGLVGPAREIAERRRGDGLLFPTPKSTQYNRTSIKNALDRAFKRAARDGKELERWTANELRHGIANLLRQKLGSRAATIWLGHASPSTTEIYLETMKEDVLRVADSVKELEHGSKE